MKEVELKNLKNIGPQQIDKLLAISTTLSSTLDLSQLLNEVLEAATELTQTEAASILLLDEKSGELRFAAATGGSAPGGDISVPMEGSIAGWIVREGRPLILDDVQRDTRHYDQIDSSKHFTTRTMLGVPLETKGRVIGALEAINKKDNAAYTQEDVALLQALASQSAVAIENARLFQQSDLISEIMHELKTPLMALTAATDILARDIPQQRQQEIIDMIRRETTRLSKMTRSFLDLARLESGRAQLKREPIELDTVVRDVVTLQEAQAAVQQVQIDYQVPDTLPALVGDRDRIKQVLLNLVSNAIKYNVEQGKVTVVVERHPTAIRIAVIDTGRGINVENLEHLFDRFYRVPDSEGFSEGTGLGLAITRQIIEAHGGQINVSSQPGKGSTFSFTMPLDEELS